MKWFFVRFCLFLSFLYLIQIHISEPISTELCTRLPPSSGGGRTVCMNQQYLTLFDLFCQESVQNTGHNMAAGSRVIATALYP